MTDCQTLLADYARTGSDAAFRELVTRYVDLVYSTALRLVEGDRHQAEDVAQTVFVDLARTARTLSGEVKLGGWLHRHTCFVAANTMRGERRRLSRERQAVEMNMLQDNSNFALVAPILDEAIDELGDTDRTAILLRFYEQEEFRSVGAALGSTEDAARMRVTRALEKLQELLVRRGVTTSATALSVALTAHAVQAAPVGLAATIYTAAAFTGTTVVTTATKVIAMTTLQKTLITATIAAAVGTGIYESRQAARLRSELQALRQNQAEQSQRAQQERDEASARQSSLREENDRLQRTTTDLLKLRAEVNSLRASEQEMVKLRAAGGRAANASASPAAQPVNEELPKDSWADAGFATPQSALRTRGWSILNGNRDRFRESIFITDEARKSLEDMVVRMAEASNAPDKKQLLQEILDKKFGVEEGLLLPMMAENQKKSYTGYHILSQQAPSADEMVFEIETQMASAPAKKEALRFRRFGNDWKVVIDESFIKAGQ